MIFDVKVEVDWIEEGGNIDEELKQAVVSQIITQAKSSAVEQIKALVYNQAKNQINTWILEELHKFADRPIRLTDKWGDTVEHHQCLSDMFKEQFDQFFDASVDKNGKPIDGCGYGGKLSRIDYLMDTMTAKQLATATEKIDREIKRTLDKNMENIIKEKIVKHTSEQVAKLTML